MKRAYIIFRTIVIIAFILAMLALLIGLLFIVEEGRPFGTPSPIP